MFSLARYSLRLDIKLIHRKTCHIVRGYSFLNNEQFSSNEQNYMRNVLKRTSDCALFDPANNLIVQRQSTEENPTISTLISVISKLNKYNPTDYSTLNEKLLLPLNDQCLKSYQDWPINSQLYALDVWHFVKGAKRIPFFNVVLNDFLNRFVELPNGVALQIMYYVAWSKRQFNSTEEMIVTKRFEEIVNGLSLDEISIYCLAFIKSELKVGEISLTLVKSLYDCLMQNELRKFDDIGVTGVIKAVRRFSTTDHIPDLKNLQHQLVPYAKDASFMTLTHVIQLGSKQRVFNQQLIEIILERFLNNLDKLRLKDVERALLAISIFNCKNSAIEKQFLNKVQKHLLMSLDTKFSSSLIRCISYLVVCGVVDTKLIDWALDPKTHSDTYGRAISDDEHALLLIDSYAKINLQKTYTGCRLPEYLCAELMPKVAENEVAGQKSELGNEIDEILRANGVNSIQCQAAPHIPFPDVFFVYNKRTNQTFSPLAKNTDGTILKASDLHRNKPDLEAVAILPCLQRQTVFNSNRYNGLFQLRLDQLKMLGFKTIVIKKSIWKLYQNTAAQRRYLALELCRNNIFLLNKCFNITYKSKGR